MTGVPLERKGWYDVELPPRVRDSVTMLSHEERQLLYYLARDFYSGEGVIVDGGAFVGSSTLALASGLADRGLDRPGVIHSYDQFILDEFMLFGGWIDPQTGYAAGDNFRALFDANVGDLLRLVTVHEGDLRQESWPGGSIEILFLDILKTWELNDAGIRLFFPPLTAGSVVVHQDYVHELCPWIPITMEYYADHFELIDFTPGATTVWRVAEPIPEQALISVERDLSPADKRRLMARNIERFEGYSADVLRCSAALLEKELGDRRAARRQLARAIESSPDHWHVQHSYRYISLALAKRRVIEDREPTPYPAARDRESAVAGRLAASEDGLAESAAVVGLCAAAGAQPALLVGSPSAEIVELLEKGSRPVERVELVRAEQAGELRALLEDHEPIGLVVMTVSDPAAASAALHELLEAEDTLATAVVAVLGTGAPALRAVLADVHWELYSDARLVAPQMIAADQDGLGLGLVVLDREAASELGTAKQAAEPEATASAPAQAPQVEAESTDDDERARLAARVSELERALETVYGSKSWRLTAPLRAAGDAARYRRS